MTLLELDVRGLALIERLRFEPDPGFTVITGETGAGKSLLIDALALVLGARADAGLVRTGSGAARVQALFDRVPEPLICVREVGAAGRSTARVDDDAVTAARLAEVAGPLVEIHGQHEQQRLLEAARQRDLLDAFGGHLSLRDRVAAAVEAWRANRRALDALEADPRAVARSLELHDHESAEIEAAALRPGEADELRERLARAASAGQVSRLLASVRERLLGESTGAHDVVARAGRDGDELARLDAGFAVVASRLQGLLAEIDDVAADLRRLASGIEHDAAATAELESRLGAIYALERKYGPDEAAVVDHGRRARAEAERLRGLEAERAARMADDTRLELEARDLAAELTRKRASAAEALGMAVTAALEELGFRQARFAVTLAPGPLGGSGAETVQFLIAPNPGEPAMPLARIASGGELSRLSLAVKQVLATADETPTLVFDEIDAGIGARSADRVGSSLHRLAEHHQVLCVTHLAQIAAYADAHWRIEKREHGGRTVTETRRLQGEERLTELAIMLAGESSGDAARDAAVELVARAAGTPDRPPGAASPPAREARAAAASDRSSPAEA